MISVRKPSSIALSSVAFSSVWLVIFSSAFVRTEPAIYDLLILLVGGALFLFGFVKSHGQFLAPYLLLFVFTICNFIPMIGLSDDHFSVALIQAILTIYLILTWVFFSSLIKEYQEKAFLTIMNAYTACGTFSAFLGVTAYFHLIPSANLFIWEGSRAVGFFKDPNVFGPFLVPVCIYSLYRIINATGTKRWYWVFALSFCSLGVLFSFCRAAWISLILGFVIFLLLPGSIQLRQKFSIILITLAVGIFAILLVQQNEQASRLLSGRTSLQGYDDERFATQASAFEIALSNPMGIGGHQTDFLFGLPPHNLYITTITEYGWLGFVSLVGFMLLSLQNAFKSALLDDSSRKPLHGIVVASLIGLMIGVLSIDPLHWRHFWLLFSLAWLPMSKQSDTEQYKRFKAPKPVRHMS
jgi:O-antigen ligase